MLSCHTCQSPVCISQLGIFSHVSEKHRAKIIASVHRLSFNKGEHVIFETQPLHQFVVISSGSFKCYTHHEEGKQKTLYFLHKGDFFGQESLFKESQSAFSVEAMEPSSVCMIDAATVQELIKQDHEFSLAIIHALSSRIQNLESELSNVTIDPLEQRLLKLLHTLALDFGFETHQGIVLKLPLTQEEIAMRLGVSRESVSRSMNQLKKNEKLRILKQKQVLLLNN